jgi:hypothetical protein
MTYSFKRFPGLGLLRMNDTTLKQIAAANPMVNNGSVIWTSYNIGAILLRRLFSATPTQRASKPDALGNQTSQEGCCTSVRSR